MIAATSGGTGSPSPGSTSPTARHGRTSRSMCGRRSQSGGTSASASEKTTLPTAASRAAATSTKPSAAPRRFSGSGDGRGAAGEGRWARPFSAEAGERLERESLERLLVCMVAVAVTPPPPPPPAW